MFHIKKSLMETILSAKKRKQPFDYEKAENFTFKTTGDGTFNNSYYFSAHSYEKNQSLYTRLGLRDNGKAEAWFFYIKDGKSFNLKDMIFDTESSPLKVEKKDGIWTFSFNGKLTDDDGNLLDANIECAFNSDKPAVDFFYHMPAMRTATAIAQDKWTKDFFAGVQENNSVHYEQEGRLTGKAVIGENQFDIDLPCLRDHSYGKRVWGYMNNHVWLAAIDDVSMLNFSMVSYPSLSILEVGHLRQENSTVEFMLKAHYDRNTVVQDDVPKTLEMVLETDKENTIGLHAELICANTYVFEDGAYRLIEGIADYTINGKKLRGILEVGFNADKTRFMNGKEIKKIKE